MVTDESFGSLFRFKMKRVKEKAGGFVDALIFQNIGT